MDELLASRNEAETNIVLATVTEVTSTGIKIKIDGNESAGEKEYKCNSAQVFSVGDRVKITKNSGTIIIEYRVGSPCETVLIPSGGDDGDVLVKDGATDYKLKWSSGGGGSGSEIVNGDYKLTLSSLGILSASATNRRLRLGTQNIPFNGFYVQGEIFLGTSVDSKIGFFGHSPVARQSVSSSASVATLITALKAYGLIV